MKKTTRVEQLAVDVYEPARAAETEVLFVHGFGSSRIGTKAAFLGPELARRGHRVIIPELQGHGDSGGSFAEITIARSIGDVVRVANATGFAVAPRRILVGSSFGGLVCAWLCVRRPRFADRLVLIAPAFGFVERHVAALPAEVAAAWRRGERLRVEKDWFSVDLTNAILKEAGGLSIADLAGALRTPTRIVHGDRDEDVPVSASYDFQQACPHVELHIVEGGDHRLAEHLDLIADVIV